MTDLLDLIAEAESTTTVRYPKADPGHCEFCGEQLTGWAWDSVNHGRIKDTCVSRWLTRNHVRRAEHHLDPANRDELSQNCFNHPGKRKNPCPQKCFEKEYEHYANIATRRWGGDGWKQETDT